MPVWANSGNDGRQEGGSVTWGRQRDRSTAHTWRQSVARGGKFSAAPGGSWRQFGGTGGTFTVPQAPYILTGAVDVVWLFDCVPAWSWSQTVPTTPCKLPAAV